MNMDWADLPIDEGVAEIICCLLGKVDTATTHQSEPIVDLQFNFNFNWIQFSLSWRDHPQPVEQIVNREVNLIKWFYVWLDTYLYDDK